MNVQKLINKLLICPMDAEVYMEGCPGQEFSVGMGSFSCEGEEDNFIVDKVDESPDGTITLRRVK